MRRFLIFGLLIAVLLSACSAPETNQELTEAEQSAEVVVYRSPT
jgi:hypothetical protein